MVMSLALLPAEKITAAWQELRDEAIPSLSPSDKRQLVDFRRYVESYWMCQVTPAVLSVAFTPRRTNNEVEARNVHIAEPPFSMSCNCLISRKDHNLVFRQKNHCFTCTVLQFCFTKTLTSSVFLLLCRTILLFEMTLTSSFFQQFFVFFVGLFCFL